MTITNRELFYRDPTQTKIPNDGVAQVVRPETEQQWDVLRWELHSFVCDGQYARGLERILDSFLTNLSQAQQPAVWVSGFYGSGKSHLVRVLEHLWRDVELPNGERARDLVTLTDEIRDHLTELSTAGKRLGGLWSAAGTLASGKSDAVRLAFLSILFESAGLPTQYEHARFTIWAQENGYLDAVRAAVEAEGRTFDKEVHDLYVSPVIAKALLDADPTLGSSVKDVRELLKAQFPPTTKDVTDDEMFDVMDDVLRLQSTTPGKLPLTLVVLDEMQQYIGDDNDKALRGAEHRAGLLGAVREHGALRRHRPERPHGHAHTAEAHRPVPAPRRAVRQRRRDRRPRGRAAQEAGARPPAQVDDRRGSRRDRPATRRHSLRAAGGGEAEAGTGLPGPAEPLAPVVRDAPRR